MSLADEVKALRKVPMFADIDEAQLKLFAFASERLTLRAGEELFHQNDTGSDAYIILCGKADVVIDTPAGPLTVSRVGACDVIGEIALLCDVPRTATVVARSDMEVLCITRDLFFRFVSEFPGVAIATMRALAHRLDNTTKSLIAARIPGAVAPTSKEGAVAPTSKEGAVAPTSKGSAVAPTSTEAGTPAKPEDAT